VLTTVNILACVWLLRWTMKPRSATEKIGGGADTGHTWDGRVSKSEIALNIYYTKIEYSALPQTNT
ncbi:hypothetical protein HGB07_05225, partial [Candidatus Roizmanbacteria bacterium]|nr:hypothetical protein [Candidatus Roizmanbacteria bacterium]